MKKVKEFLFEEIFEHERGRRYKREDNTEGEIAYIEKKKKNNGIDAFVNPPEYMKIYRNKLTLSNSGSVGYCFYHSYDFVASDHVMVIWIKNRNLNENIALYLKPIFEKIRYRYSFGREINKSRLLSEKILLPVDLLDSPDWEYMEEYISNLKRNISFETINSKNFKNDLDLNLQQWKLFHLSDVFDSIEQTKGTTTFELIPGNDIPYIGAKKKDNGFVERVSREGNEPFISKGNCIVFIHLGDGSGGFSTYQSEDFIGMSGKTSCGYSAKLNKYNGLFIVTMLDKERYRYSFGRGWTGNRFKKSQIYLPVDIDGFPDWKYMENTIKKLPYGEYL